MTQLYPFSAAGNPNYHPRHPDPASNVPVIARSTPPFDGQRFAPDVKQFADALGAIEQCRELYRSVRLNSSVNALWDPYDVHILGVDFLRAVLRYIADQNVRCFCISWSQANRDSLASLCGQPGKPSPCPEHFFTSQEREYWGDGFLWDALAHMRSCLEKVSTEQTEARKTSPAIAAATVNEKPNRIATIEKSTHVDGVPMHVRRRSSTTSSPYNRIEASEEGVVRNSSKQSNTATISNAWTATTTSSTNLGSNKPISSQATSVRDQHQFGPVSVPKSIPSHAKTTKIYQPNETYRQSQPQLPYAARPPRGRKSYDQSATNASLPARPPVPVNNKGYIEYAGVPSHFFNNAIPPTMVLPPVPPTREHPGQPMMTAYPAFNHFMTGRAPMPTQNSRIFSSPRPGDNFQTMMPPVSSVDAMQQQQWAVFGYPQYMQRPPTFGPGIPSAENETHHTRNIPSSKKLRRFSVDRESRFQRRHSVSTQFNDTQTQAFQHRPPVARQSKQPLEPFPDFSAPPENPTRTHIPSDREDIRDVWLGCYGDNVTEADIRSFFENRDQSLAVERMSATAKDSINQNYCFVVFHGVSQARLALQLDGESLKGRPVSVRVPEKYISTDNCQARVRSLGTDRRPLNPHRGFTLNADGDWKQSNSSLYRSTERKSSVVQQPVQAANENLALTDTITYTPQDARSQFNKPPNHHSETVGTSFSEPSVEKENSEPIGDTISRPISNGTGESAEVDSERPVDDSTNERMSHANDNNKRVTLSKGKEKGEVNEKVLDTKRSSGKQRSPKKKQTKKKPPLTASAHESRKSEDFATTGNKIDSSTAKVPCNQDTQSIVEPDHNMNVGQEQTYDKNEISTNDIQSAKEGNVDFASNASATEKRPSISSISSKGNSDLLSAKNQPNQLQHNQTREQPESISAEQSPSRRALVAIPGVSTDRPQIPPFNPVSEVKSPGSNSSFGRSDSEKVNIAEGSSPLEQQPTPASSTTTVQSKDVDACSHQEQQLAVKPTGPKQIESLHPFARQRQQKKLKTVKPRKGEAKKARKETQALEISVSAITSTGTSDAGEDLQCSDTEQSPRTTRRILDASKSGKSSLRSIHESHHRSVSGRTDQTIDSSPGDLFHDARETLDAYGAEGDLTPTRMLEPANGTLRKGNTTVISASIIPESASQPTRHGQIDLNSATNQNSADIGNIGSKAALVEQLREIDDQTTQLEELSTSIDQILSPDLSNTSSNPLSIVTEPISPSGSVVAGQDQNMVLKKKSRKKKSKSKKRRNTGTGEADESSTTANTGNDIQVLELEDSEIMHIASSSSAPGIHINRQAAINDWAQNSTEWAPTSRIEEQRPPRWVSDVLEHRRLENQFKDRQAKLETVQCLLGMAQQRSLEINTAYGDNQNPKLAAENRPLIEESHPEQAHSNSHPQVQMNEDDHSTIREKTSPSASSGTVDDRLTYDQTHSEKGENKEEDDVSPSTLEVTLDTTVPFLNEQPPARDRLHDPRPTMLGRKMSYAEMLKATPK